MNNLHISLTSFGNESRVLKETDALVQSRMVDHLYIAALYEPGLNEHERIDDKRELWRVKLKSRSLPKSLVFQLIKYIEYCFRVALFARKKRIKLVNVHSLGLLPLGYFTKLITAGKLVYDAHELETEANGLRGVRKKLAKIVERMFIGKADLTIVVGSAIEQWYRRSYTDIPIVTVMNCPIYKQVERSDRLRKELGIPAEDKIVLYQGALSSGRSVQLLLDAFQSREYKDYAMVFMGYGELEAEIRDASNKYAHIYFMPAVPPNEVLDYTVSADIGLSLGENTCLSYQHCLPNKLFEYVIARIPVIVSNLPDIKRVVNEYGIGQVMEDWNKEELFLALDRVGLMPLQKLEEGLERAAHQFNWQREEQTMIDAYKEHIFVD